MNPTDLFALLPDMAVFARVVDAGNFSVAARQLGSTPSTVSRQIKRLEDALATRLLERSTRTVRVTESGAQVARFCRDMVSAASGAVDAAGQLADRPQGKVRVSAPTAFAKTVIHPLIPGFLRAYGEVDLQLLFTDHDVDPLADDVDLARGDLLAGPQRPAATREFDAIVVGLTEKDIKPGQMLKLRYGSSLIKARVSAVTRTLDLDGVSDVEDPESVAMNDIAHTTIQTQAELPVEDYAARGAVGNFLLIDQSSGNTLAAGFVGHRLR